IIAARRIGGLCRYGQHEKKKHEKNFFHSALCGCLGLRRYAFFPLRGLTILGLKNLSAAAMPLRRRGLRFAGGMVPLLYCQYPGTKAQPNWRFSQGSGVHTAVKCGLAITAPGIHMNWPSS